MSPDYMGPERRHDYLALGETLATVERLNERLDKLPSKDEFAKRSEDLNNLLHRIAIMLAVLGIAIIIFGLLLFFRIQGGHSRLEEGQRITNCILRTAPELRDAATEVQCKSLLEG